MKILPLADDFTPEELVKKDFNKVFVITVRFSEMPLGKADEEEWKAVRYEIK